MQKEQLYTINFRKGKECYLIDSIISDDLLNIHFEKVGNHKLVKVKSK